MAVHYHSSSSSLHSGQWARWDHHLFTEEEDGGAAPFTGEGMKCVECEGVKCVEWEGVKCVECEGVKVISCREQPLAATDSGV